MQKNRDKEKKERELAIQKQRREQRKKEQKEAKLEIEKQQKQIKQVCHSCTYSRKKSKSKSLKYQFTHIFQLDLV